MTPNKILEHSVQSIWEIDDKTYSVQYSDNVILNQSKNSIIFDRYCWDLFLLYPNTPIPSSCSVVSVIGSEVYSFDTHIKLLERIFKTICDYNNIVQYKDKEPLLKQVYNIVNAIYNEVVQRASSSVTTIDAIDFVEVINDNKIKEIHSSITSKPESVDACYKQIKQRLREFPPGNRFVQAYRSKAINENQANQCIGPRGFVTDLDRTVFRQPVVSGFIRGMNSLFEMMAESRTAAKALNANDTHIQRSEYASRRMQLLSMSVETIVNGDCGSTEYLELLVDQSILENIIGKYYLDEETHTLKYIKGNEQHLLGKSLKLRTALGCRHTNRHQICTTCLGKISENFKENSNLGYSFVAYLMEKLSQSILGTKHLTHSVKDSGIVLDGLANKYFYVKGFNNLYFNHNTDLSNLYMLLPTSDLNKLVDVINMKHTNIALNKIGELEDITLITKRGNESKPDTVYIGYRDRKCVLTKPLLEYIKEVGLTPVDRGNYIVSLAKFNKEYPVFHNPLKETNIVSFVDSMASAIEGIDPVKSGGTKKDKGEDPKEKLVRLFNMILDRNKCNLSILEVIVYATTAFNLYSNNYRHARNSMHGLSVPKSTIFRHRSISQLFVFEEQIKEIIAHPNVAFSSVNRQRHPMDVLFAPQETILNYEN
jgi:hypothetical protein